MADVVVEGLVATTPRHIVTNEGLPITSFRLAQEDKAGNGQTNWYTITSFRTLAINVASSVNKGDRIIVHGSLRIRDWDNGERSGTSVEIEAESVGHDLSWGTSIFTRTVLTKDK